VARPGRGLDGQGIGPAGGGLWGKVAIWRILMRCFNLPGPDTHGFRTTLGLNPHEGAFADGLNLARDRCRE
jgi:hypothetical protein